MSEREREREREREFVLGEEGVERREEKMKG